MGIYRKRPVVVEARRFDSVDQGSELAAWCGGTNKNSPEGIDIPTLEGTMRADLGDYIIRGIAGEFYPCKAEIFLASYEEITAYVEVWESAPGIWYWHEKGGNHEVTAPSEPYTTQEHAIVGAIGATNLPREVVRVIPSKED